MSQELARASLEHLEEARLAFLRARLGEAGLASLIEMRDIWEDTFASIYDSGDFKELTRFYAMEKQMAASGEGDMLDDAEDAFITKVHNLFIPINGLYHFHSGNDQTFSVYRPIETAVPEHYGKILEIIGCVFNKNGSYRTRKTLQDSTRGRIPYVVRLPFEQQDAEVLDQALQQIDEIALLISAE